MDLEVAKKMPFVKRQQFSNLHFTHIIGFFGVNSFVWFYQTKLLINILHQHITLTGSINISIDHINGFFGVESAKGVSVDVPHFVPDH